MHSNDVLVSIITISSNSSRTIDRTINSVLNSTYKNIEYIIIDNASSDGTLDIIKKYQKSFKLFKYISEKDNGVSDAFNKGLKYCNGELIGILNSDDWYESSTIQNSVKEFLLGADVIIGDVNKNNTIFKSSLRGLKYKMTIMHPSSFISRNTYEKVGIYDDKFKYAMDYDFFIRVIYLNKFNVVYNSCSFTYMDESGISNNGLNNILKSIYECKSVQLKNKIISPLFAFTIFFSRWAWTIFVFLFKYSKK